MASILLTRSKKENDYAAKKLNKLGFASISLPMLEYVDHAISSSDLSHYKHIIITSKYAAKIACSIYNKPVECWVVGKQSANILSQNPNIKVTGIAKNVKELLSIIDMISEKEAEEFFSFSAYLSGDVIAENLSPFIKRVVIYRVLYTDSISKHQIYNISNSNIKYILVYSKNCAINLVKLIEKYNLFQYLRDSTIIAISKEVSDIFSPINIRAISSEEPNFEDMLKLLISHEKK